MRLRRGKTGAIIIAAAAIIAALAAGVYFPIRQGAPRVADARENILQGFAAGTRVDYKIFADKGEPLKGTMETGEDGKLVIPSYPAADFGPRANTLTYDFLIEEPGKSNPVNMVFTINTGNGYLAVKASGLGEFIDIALSGASGDIKTKSDWAGILRGENIKLDPAGGRAVQLAFYDTGFADMIPRNPKIIEILTAPGGGGPPGTGGINEFTPTYCYPPPEDFSYCPPDHINDFIRQNQLIIENYVQALILMGEQLSVVMMQHVQIIGSFFDATNQLMTQRELQRLQAEAHKDYHPGELMCEFGSFVKSIPRAEEKMAFEKRALNDMLMTYYKNTEHTSGSEGYAGDVEAKIDQFRRVYCDVQDNNNGLSYICGNGGGAGRERFNKDIDFTRTADQSFTLDINFDDQTKTADEEDVMALAKNLYFPRALDPGLPQEMPEKYPVYMDARNMFAVQNVAHHSFASIMAMKSRTTPGLAAQSGWGFMKAYMREFGLSDDEINEMLGQYPSYYAQMEVLTKKMFQHPDFYTNLYDKPANVERIGVSMDAVRLMQMRDQYESALRKEMLISLLVEQALAKHVDRVNAAIVSSTR